MKESNKIKSAAKPLALDLIRGHFPSTLNPQSSILNQSSNNYLVSVSHVGKKYFYQPQKNMRAGFCDLFKRIFLLSKINKIKPEEFFAVDDVSFTLLPGESLGFVGVNGSGKTTLLKMIAGMQKPDIGSIKVNGNIQALINLGAGFNRKLTGRENIYNAASIRGLSHQELSLKIDEIIDFSELGKFIDSPLETYSSGMAARLGFSLCSHLNPDLIVIDEALSVGDAAFRNKCFIKMQELKKKKVTMILVSHSASEMIQFCDRAIWLDKGKMIFDGAVKNVFQQYEKFIEEKSIRQAVKSLEASLYGATYHEADKIKNLNVDVLLNEQSSELFPVGSSMKIKYQFDLHALPDNLNVTLNIYRKEDGLLLTAISTLNGDLLRFKKEGAVACEVVIKHLSLAPGNYVIVMPIHDGVSYLYRHIVKEFRVVNHDRQTWGLLDFHYDYTVHE